MDGFDLGSDSSGKRHVVHPAQGDERERLEPLPAEDHAAIVAEPKRKLSYKDARELELLPARIEQLEAEIAARTASMNEPKFYQQDSATILAFNEASAKLHAELEHAYQRWNELDA